MAKEIKIPNPFKNLFNSSKKPGNYRVKYHREINLVPDIKNEMIKTLKLRNFIFFLCIVVASASIGVTFMFGAIVGGQSIAIENKTNTIEKLSKTLSSYSELSEFLTIKDQVGNIDTLSNNKKVLSRTFDVLTAIIPTGADTIQISELTVNLSGETPTYDFDAQANAGTSPFIDYRVLDAFQKSMQYLTFDYGDYVDKEGNTIPAYCVIESGEDGATFRNDNGDYYGLWTIYADGCDPGATTDEDGNVIGSSSGYELEEYDGQQVVRIWRTPQFQDWYHAEDVDNQPMMTENGQITNVAHFESSCINYKVELRDKVPVKLDDSDNSCLLVPDGTEGIKVTESSNGRGSSDELVLRFSAQITLNPDIYSFNNHHFIAIPPSTRRNVTDSYVQIQSIFGERAADCATDDTTCNSKTNLNGDNQNG